MVISKDFSNEDVVGSLKETLPQANDLIPPSYPSKVKALISLNSLTRFSYPQTLKLIGYITNQIFIILVDSGSTHNCIHHHLPMHRKNFKS
jgi:hypothetical protein